LSMYHQQSQQFFAPGTSTGAGISAVSGPMDAAAQFFSGQHSPSQSTGQLGNVPAIGEYFMYNWVVMDGTNQAVTGVHFDKYEDLLWCVNCGGHLTGYYGPQLSKYVSLHVQKDLRQVCAASPLAEAGVFTMAKSGVACYSKFGQRRWSYSCPGMTVDLAAMIHDPEAGRLTLGGRQDRVLQLDTGTGRLVKCVDMGPDGCEFLRHNGRFICAASAKGTVTLLDRGTGRKEHSLSTVTGQLADVAVQDSLLVTCGWSVRHDGNVIPDRLLQAFDLRVLRPVQPFCVQLDPHFVRFLPAMHDRLLVGNSLGEFQFLQLGQSMPSSPVYQLGVGATDIDISASSRCIAVGDGAGGVYLLSADTADVIGPRFNVSPLPTVFPDDPVYSPNPIALGNESFFFTSMPFGYPKESDASSAGSGYRCALTSDWAPRLCHSYERRVKLIDEAIISGASTTRGLAIARKPAGWGRTHFPYYSLTELSELVEQSAAKCQSLNNACDITSGSASIAEKVSTLEADVGKN
ncbi:hypothetical protein BOX15_Mlig003889g1, partial [Macrostomum lignano]